MTWLFVMNAFVPLYITEVSKNTVTFAGLILGASGWGGFLWGWILPWLSDFTGCKPVLLFVAALSAVVPLTYQVPFLIGHPWLLAIAGFIANGGQGIAALGLVLVPTESVPAQFAATAIDLSTLVGEVIGGCSKGQVKETRSREVCKWTPVLSRRCPHKRQRFEPIE
jgi:predicted MFS family arabinose efflux permease